MADLKFEVWKSTDSISCVAISLRWDRMREPDATLQHVIYAGSYREAMERYHAWNGWGPDKPMPGIDDQPFTEDEMNEQLEYLRIRDLPK